MVAIITDVHYRMSPALIRDLGESGVAVVTCERESRRPAPGASSRWTENHVWLSDGNYPDALAALCRETSKKYNCRPALLPVGVETLSILARRPEKFAGLCGLCIPSKEQLDLLNDKAALAELAQKLGIPVPESHIRQPGESIIQLAKRVPLPCVIKPICGEKLGLTASDRYIIAHSPEEADRAYRHYLALSGEPPVVQTYLPGSGFGCSVLARDGNIIAAISHRRLREYPISGGPSSCCQCADRPDLLDAAARIAAETGLNGLAMFEFKEDASKTPRLLEANPRIWGTFPLARAARSKIPLLWCALSWNNGGPDAPVPLPEVPKPLLKKMIFAVSDLLSAGSSLRRGDFRPAAAAFADLLNPSVADGLFEWGDPMPGAAYLRALLTRGRKS